jgi:hypothetical protein
MVGWAMEMDTDDDGHITDADEMNEDEKELFNFLVDHCDHNDDGKLSGEELCHCATKYFNEE